MRQEGSKGFALSLALASAGLALAALPVFLVGGLAVQMRADLGFSEVALGLAVTLAFVTAAIAGPIGGRFADWIGSRSAVLVGAALSTVALVGLGAFARSWYHVALFLVIAGLAFAFMDPGLAILVSQAVPANRQGVAFGVKEASIPSATFAAGLAVPVIALSAGWRWAFMVGILPFVAVVGLLGKVSNHRPVTPSQGKEKPRPRTPARSALVLVAVATAIGSAAGSGVSVFLTESAVAMGISPAGAGWLLAAGSAAGIATRLLTGVRADRRPGGQLGVISVMLFFGAAAMVLGASGVHFLLILGAMGAFAGGWGWSGLLFLTLVRSNPTAPGAAAGIGLTGLSGGNAIGPLLFGLTAQAYSFKAAWLGAAVLAAIAATLMRSARSGFPYRH